MTKFPKDQFFQNLRFMLRSRGIKIGAFEEKAGVKPGQISRWEKGDALPSADFLMAAKEITGTSLDLLLEIDLEAVSPNELYITEALNSFRKDTVSGAIVWKELDENKKHEQAIEDSECFEAEILNSSVRIYLLIRNTTGGENIKEVFTVDNHGEKNRVGTTNGSSVVVSKSIELLYESVVQISGEIRIPTSLRAQLDAYMYNKEPFMSDEMIEGHRIEAKKSEEKSHRLPSYAERIKKIKEESL